MRTLPLMKCCWVLHSFLERQRFKLLWNTLCRCLILLSFTSLWANTLCFSLSLTLPLCIVVSLLAFANASSVSEFSKASLGMEHNGPAHGTFQAAATSAPSIYTFCPSDSSSHLADYSSSRLLTVNCSRAVQLFCWPFWFGFTRLLDLVWLPYIIRPTCLHWLSRCPGNHLFSLYWCGVFYYQLTDRHICNSQ